MGTPCPCQGVRPHSGAGALRGAHPQVRCPQDGVNPMKVTSSAGAAVSSQNKPTVESKGEGRWMAVLGEMRICLHVHLILRVNGSNQVLTARNGNGGEAGGQGGWRHSSRGQSWSRWKGTEPWGRSCKVNCQEVGLGSGTRVK